MKKWLVCLAILASNGCGDVAFACETEATATPDSECVVTPRASVRGIWFRLDIADGLRKDHAVLPELQLQLKSYVDLAATREAQLLAIRQADALRVDISDKLQQTNEALARDATRAREERDAVKASFNAWYRSPFLWTGVGVLTTLAIGATIGYATHAF